MIEPAKLLPNEIDRQPYDIRGLSPETRDALIVSVVRIDGTWHVLSRYGDDVWKPSPGTHNTNSELHSLWIDLRKIQPEFRDAMRAILYRFLRRGRSSLSSRPHKLFALFYGAKPFLRHLRDLGIKDFSTITRLCCSSYVQRCQAYRLKNGNALKPSTLRIRYATVEMIFELSQYTDRPMPTHPWPETSAQRLAGLKSGRIRTVNTPLIPDDAFCSIYQAAWKVIEDADRLIDLRRQLIAIENGKRLGENALLTKKNEYLVKGGWNDGLKKFYEAHLDIRTACYVVLASLSGCRNHELAFVQTGSCYMTTGEDGERYWWLRSTSTKTGEGRTEWMIPEAAIAAIRVIERWAEPFQQMIEDEIGRLRATNPWDLGIAEALRHRNAVFLCVNSHDYQQAHTVSRTSWNLGLKDFASKNGINWRFTTHQFRRKFANYAARSQFGDLRYLKHHFKHWSFDMTLAYAMNELQELDLYSEIFDELADIKEGVVAEWMVPEAPLAGGLGKRLVAWRGSREVTLFRSHGEMIRTLSDGIALRSNGHAWCTADDGVDCIGNGGLSRTRCIDCRHGVIGKQHLPIYQGLYEHLLSLRECDDIGEPGRASIEKDIDRCTEVFASLGFDTGHGEPHGAH